jgi:hypothetical protein
VQYANYQTINGIGDKRTHRGSQIVEGCTTKISTFARKRLTKTTCYLKTIHEYEYEKTSKSDF